MSERIKEHPILGVREESQIVKFRFDGKEIEGYEGETIAAALKAAGVMVHRYTQKEHKPRGIFCAIGRCTKISAQFFCLLKDAYYLRMLKKRYS